MTADTGSRARGGGEYVRSRSCLHRLLPLTGGSADVKDVEDVEEGCASAGVIVN